MPGDAGQLEAAGEVMLWDDGNGLPSVWPVNQLLFRKNILSTK